MDEDPGFVRESDLSSATSSKLLEVLNDQGKIQMEHAITIAPVCLVYLRVGRGWPASVICISTHVSSEHYPNVLAEASSSSAGNLIHEQQLIAYDKNCAAPAYDYFSEKFDNDLKPISSAGF